MLFKDEAPVEAGFGGLQGHKLGQNLPGDDVLDIAQAVDVGGAVLSTRFQVKVIEIGIEVMPQIVLHHVLPYGVESLWQGRRS